MTCNLCKNKIWIETHDMGTTQSEYDIEAGHKIDCRYYKTSSRFEVDRIYNAPMPKFKRIWTEKDELEHRRVKGLEFLRERGINI